MKKGYVYILSNKNRTTFYIGVTNNLINRINQHINEDGSIFTTKYKCFYLVYFEEFIDINDAIKRETALKNWKRQWKIDLIKSVNKEMKDLFDELI